MRSAVLWAEATGRIYSGFTFNCILPKTLYYKTLQTAHKTQAGPVRVQCWNGESYLRGHNTPHILTSLLCLNRAPVLNSTTISSNTHCSKTHSTSTREDSGDQGKASSLLKRERERPYKYNYTTSSGVRGRKSRMCKAIPERPWHSDNTYVAIIRK
jgi:hypothetical protein